MTIYAEYLFLENFIVGLGILKLTAMACGRCPGKARLVGGGVMCGLFSFIILFPLSGVMTFFYEIVFVIAVMAAVFALADCKVLLKAGVVFYCISFVLGGSTVAFLFLSDSAGTVNNGFVYIGAAGYLVVLAGGTIGAVMLMSVMKFIKQRSAQAPKIVKISIEMMGRTMECMGSEYGRGIFYIGGSDVLPPPLSPEEERTLTKMKFIGSFADSPCGGNMRSGPSGQHI